MPDLLIENRGPVTIFTINRPEKRNAYNRAVVEGFNEGFEAFTADPDQYVAIVTGAGDLAFCAGNDLSETAGAVRAGRSDRGFSDGFTDMFGIGATPKPVIAAINGMAVGGGVEVGLASDIRIAADTAWFGLFEPKRGIVAGVATQLLPRMLTYGDAALMALAAERVPADEALRIGLVQRVVPAADLMDEALAMAQRICELSQVAVQMSKAVLRFNRDLLLAESVRHARQLQRLMLLGADSKEGPVAFVEKRPTEFTNLWPDQVG